MITPQNTTQSTDQIPVTAPRPYEAIVLANGACHTAVARMIVTTEPMITVCHAVIRKTASKTSNRTTGTRASRVLPATEFSGSRTWVKGAIGSS